MKNDSCIVGKSGIINGENLENCLDHCHLLLVGHKHKSRGLKSPANDLRLQYVERQKFYNDLQLKYTKQKVKEKLIGIKMFKNSYREELEKIKKDLI